jgi:hypothetical protein
LRLDERQRRVHFLAAAFVVRHKACDFVGEERAAVVADFSDALHLGEGRLGAGQRVARAQHKHAGVLHHGALCTSKLKMKMKSAPR